MNFSLKKRVARSNRRRLKVMGCRGKSAKSCRKSKTCKYVKSRNGSHCRRVKNRRTRRR